jgi:8-oxo-dGTP diphosphatase
MSARIECADTRGYKVTGDVHLLLENSAGQVLFGLRQNTSIGDGAYHLPAGHVEEGESVIDTVIAEAQEELGIIVEPEDVEFAHVMHTSLAGGRASFIFRIRRWKGVPRNCEPGKCRELRWFSPRALPKNMISEYRTALKHIAAGDPFSVCGWDEEGSLAVERESLAVEQEGLAVEQESLDVMVRQLLDRIFSDDQPD